MKKIEVIRVRIQSVCRIDPYIRLVINLAAHVDGGNVYQHWSLFKDLIDKHVGWHIPPDEPPNPIFLKEPTVWWMRTEAAYNVVLDAIGRALGIDCDHGPQAARREVEDDA